MNSDDIAETSEGRGPPKSSDADFVNFLRVLKDKLFSSCPRVCVAIEDLTIKEWIEENKYEIRDHSWRKTSKLWVFAWTLWDFAAHCLRLADLSIFFFSLITNKTIQKFGQRLSKRRAGVGNTEKFLKSRGDCRVAWSVKKMENYNLWPVAAILVRTSLVSAESYWNYAGI